MNMSTAHQILQTAQQPEPTPTPTEITNPGDGNPAPESTPAPAENTNMLSPQLANFARKEQALFQRQREMEEKKAAWENEKNELLKYKTQFEEMQNQIKNEPLKALEPYGHTYDTLTNQMLGGDLRPDDVVRKVDERLSNFEKRQEEARQAQIKAQEQAEQRQRDQAIQNYKMGISEHVKQNSANLKLTNIFDPEGQLIYETAQGYYAQHGKVLSNEEAASMVEKYFTSQFQEANKVMTAVSAPAPGEGLPEQPAPEPSVRAQQLGEKKTLTNDMQSAVATNLPAKNESDRWNRALAALESN